MPRPRKRASALGGDLRKRLDDARRALLRVHKSLLDYERAAYERSLGRIRNSGEFLQLVIHDAWFAWLRPLSEVIVRIDELLESDEPSAPAEAQAVLQQLRAMLQADEQGGDFQRHYHAALQDSPDVVLAHRDWKKAAD
jgi:hypothetical protein